MNKKIALITGITGQDGSYLFIVDNKEKMRCDCTAVRGYASGLKKYSILKKSKYVKPYIKLLKKLGLIKGV